MRALRSFDVWDTLIRRRCHPDEVKLFTAWHLYMRCADLLRDPAATPWTLFHERVAVERRIAARTRHGGLDPEYEITDVLARWASRVLRLPRGRRTAHALAEDLAEAELRQELRVSYLDPVADRMARAGGPGGGGAPLAAVSDFYMGRDRLARLLSHHAPHLKFDPVLVSCDERLNKRSGRLFTLLHQRSGVAPAAHTHVGNSVGADVRPAEALGARAVHFRNPPEDAKAQRHHDRFIRRGPACGLDLAPLDAEIRAACPPPPHLTGRQRALFRVGLRLAPVFCGVVLLATEEAARRRARAVHYFTREGEFFKRLHDAIAAVRPWDHPLPGAEVLEVSRVATFLPSLQAFTTSELMRLWNLYSSQSVAQLLRTFGANALPFEPLLRRHGIDPSERIRFPWKDARVQALLADPLALSLLERARDQRRRDALDYFRARGLRDDGRPRVIVDIGWRGTIQDNLAYLFPATPIRGVYLGLQPLLNAQPPNAAKLVFGPDPRRDDAPTAALLRFVAPLEMICNSGRGSVRGYRRGADGAVSAVRQDHPGENAVHDNFIRFLQDGALAAAPVVGEWCRRHAVWSDELRPACLQRIRETVQTPPRALARAFFELSHDEMFGEGGVVRKHARIPLGLGWRPRRSAERWRAFVRFVETTSWPQGFLVLNRRRRDLARYNRECAGTMPTAPARPAMGMIEAKRQLEQLERSRAWRWATAFKRNPLYAMYARRRWGPEWDRGPEFETAEDRLVRIKASRTYQLIVRAQATRLYRALVRPGNGGGPPRPQP